MLSQIKRFFEQHLEPRTSVEAPQHRLQLAACALMLEVARMDQSVSEEELNVVADSARRLLQLSQEEINEIMALASQEAKQATSLYQFTSLIHEHYDPQQKFQLLRLMWDVALADGRIAALEEHMIRRVADLLYIPHVQFVQARHLAEEARKA